MSEDTFEAENTQYEEAMHAAIPNAVVEDDLLKKHRKMRTSAFLFLRATCFRWASQAAALCPELITQTEVASVGDAHAGNFGLWRDAHMRLVWGINDFDEAARTSWPLDLVRLATSLILTVDSGRAGEICEAIVTGYDAGLGAPSAFVLERDHLWLRDAFAASDEERLDFWDELEAAPETKCKPPELEAPLLAVIGPVASVTIRARSAGVGSLGKPRFVALGTIRGGPVAAEIKTVMASVWSIGRESGLSEHMAHGRFRSPDPSHHYIDRHVVRRLAPNNAKLDIDKLSATLHSDLFRAMAADIAAIHAAGADAFAIRRALRTMPPQWLQQAAKRVAAWTENEWKDYRG